MGRYLRKNGHNSYVRVEENEARGCIWALLRILHYQPWRDTKKVLPYKKRRGGADGIRAYHNRRNGDGERKQESGTTKAKGLAGGTETDPNSVVDCSSRTSGSGSTISRRSRRIKARIKALLITNEDHRISKQESSSPTMHNGTEGITHSPLLSPPPPAAMALQDLLALTARAKLISSSTETVRAKTCHPTKQQLQMSSSTRDMIKDNYADIHELFKVNNKALLDVLCDESDATLVSQLLGIGNDVPDHRRRTRTAAGPRLIKSGSYPSPNSPRIGFMPLTPHHAKLEYEHNEAWPLKAAGANKKFSAAIDEASTLEDHLIRWKGRQQGTTSMMMRRTSSLTESADRYSQLFDVSSSSRRENKSQYLSSSRSLRQRDSENDRSWFDSSELLIIAPTSHGRRGSVLSDQLDRFPFSMFRNDQPAPAGLQREEEEEDDDGVGHGGGPCAEEINNTVGVPENNDTNSVSTSSSELRETACSGSSILKTCSHGDQVGVQFSEAGVVVVISSPDQSELTLRDNATVTSHPDHHHPNLQIGSKDPPNTSCNNDNTLQHHHHHHHPITNNPSTTAEFGYVKYVLEHYGFTNEHQLGSWYSSDHQPLSPTLFRQVEATCCGDDASCGEGIISSRCDRELLFDLINEGLTGGVYENSYAYYNYPKTFTFGCGIHPVQPLGDRVVEEVWRFVSGYLTWTPEVGTLIWESLTDYDLCKNDHGWMDLRMESESVGLEIEEIIFDELLDEILSC